MIRGGNPTTMLLPNILTCFKVVVTFVAFTCLLGGSHGGGMTFAGDSRTGPAPNSTECQIWQNERVPTRLHHRIKGQGWKLKAFVGTQA